MSDLPIPIDDQLLRLDGNGNPTLLAARERDTGRIVFPVPGDHDRFDAIDLPRAGTLWSWTVQRFRPKSPPYAGPEAFEPYAVGYVALGDTIMVESRLTGAPLDGFAIGMALHLVAEPFPLANGEERVTFAFAVTGGPA